MSVQWYELPVVSRFFCPPEIPLNISSPTIVSAQTSSPKIYNVIKAESLKLYR